MDHQESSMKTIQQKAGYYFRRAKEASRNRDYPHALEEYHHALSLDPQYPGAWHEMGNCLDELGRYDEALASYDTALTHDPGNAETWISRGLVLKRLGREDEAFGCINQGIELAPRKSGNNQASFSLRSDVFSQLARLPGMIRLLAARAIRRGCCVSRDVLSRSPGT